VVSFRTPATVFLAVAGFAIAVEYDNAGSEMVTDPSSVKPFERSRFACER
jgi:hypothetical protein